MGYHDYDYEINHVKSQDLQEQNRKKETKVKPHAQILKTAPKMSSNKNNQLDEHQHQHLFTFTCGAIVFHIVTLLTAI